MNLGSFGDCIEAAFDNLQAACVCTDDRTRCQAEDLGQAVAIAICKQWVVESLHDGTGRMVASAHVGLVEYQKRKSGELHKGMGQSIQQHSRGRHDDADISENGIPNVLIRPAVDVIIAAEKADLICGEMLLKETELLVAEGDSRRNKPDQLPKGQNKRGAWR